MHYYGTRLSENISRREPEGYLLCLNVPVARTGTQDYLREELGLPSGSAVIPVLRPEAEVFSPETIASFEGMPVTNDHPPEGVDTGNIRALQKGHAHNVRRGSGENVDLLLADLIITDPGLIDLILDGKREISCGYTYELCEENGQYIQRKIRGNHVAVVDAGRAGPRVSIKDHDPMSGSCVRTAEAAQRPPGLLSVMRLTDKATISERRTHPMKKSLVKKLVRMAKDGDPEAIEAVAEMLETLTEPETAEAAPAAEAEEVAAAVEDPAVVVETPEGNTVAIDEESAAGILERLDRIIELLTPAAADEDPVEEIVGAVGEAVEEAVAAAAEEDPGIVDDDEEGVLTEGTSPAEVAAIVEEIMDPVLSEVLEPDDRAGDECAEPEEQTAAAADALRAALTAIRPALARMPKKQRRRVAADISARLRKQAGRRAADGKTYAALAAASRRRPANVSADLGRRIMANRNPNYHR